MLKENMDHNCGNYLMRISREVEDVCEAWVQENMGHVPVQDATAISLGALPSSMTSLTLLHGPSVLTL